MYHALVRGLVRRGFADLSRTKNVAPIVAQFADDALFAFPGDSPIGGERRGRRAIAAWFAELFSNFPDLRITPLAIVVSGPPWATTVATRFRVDATLPDGAPYTNER
jgi:ketosteroid isomerase-like protein